MTTKEIKLFKKKLAYNAFKIDFHKDEEEVKKTSIASFLALACLYIEITKDFNTIETACRNNNIEYIFKKYFS